MSELQYLLRRVADDAPKGKSGAARYLCRAVSNDTRFTALNPETVANHVKELLPSIDNAALKKEAIGATVDALHEGLAKKKAMIDDFLSLGAKPLIPDNASHAVDKGAPKPSRRTYSSSSRIESKPPSSRAGGGRSATNESISFVERVTQQWKSLPSEAKVHTGASYAMAGLLAASALGNISAAFNKRDENGQPHVGVSQMAVGGVMALLAASALIAGNQILKGAAR